MKKSSIRQGNSTFHPLGCTVATSPLTCVFLVSSAAFSSIAVSKTF